MPRSLVTGATGFVGSNLVETLYRLGWKVECLVRKASRAATLEQLGATLRLGDLSDVEKIRQATAEKDFVFHVAGRTRALRPEEFTADNVDSTRRLMQACASLANPPTVVLVSSLAAGGPSKPGEPRQESDPDRPISAYGQSKLAAEKAAADLADEAPLSILRPPFIFGQADRASLAIFRGVRLTRIHAVPGYRRLPISVVHVADLCDALVRIAERGTRVEATRNGTVNTAPGTYHVAAERTLTYGELGKMAGRAIGCRTLVLPFPKAGFWIAGGVAEVLGQIRRKPAMLNLDKIREAVASGWECSDEKLRSELGYEPAAKLEDRFTETAEWYREQGWL